MLQTVIYVPILFAYLRCAFCDENIWRPIDKTGWIDPTDLNRQRFGPGDNVELQNLLDENFQLRRRISELLQNAPNSRPNSELATVNPSCDRSPPPIDDSRSSKETIVFKHLVQKLSSKFPYSGHYVVDIRFSRRISSLWREFLADSTFETKDLHDVAESIADLFYRIQQHNDSFDSDSGYIKSAIDVVRSYLPIFNFCILIPAAALLLTHILRVSRLQLALWMLFLIFFISIVWTWIHLYRERLAEAQARLARRDSCVPDANVPAWTALKNYIKGMFSFKPDDPCIEYYKDMMVDPVWTVSPLEAVSVALTKFFVRPLEPLADGIGRFWRALLKDLPLPAYCVVIPCTGCAFAFLVLACCGYRLRFGFGLLSLEPHGPIYQQIPESNNRSIDRLEARRADTQAIAWTDRTVRYKRSSRGRGAGTRRSSLSM